MEVVVEEKKELVENTTEGLQTGQRRRREEEVNDEQEEENDRNVKLRKVEVGEEEEEEEKTRKLKVEKKKVKKDVPVIVPMYSKWFDQEDISEKEKKAFPEFFNGSSGYKSPELYRRYRDYMMKRFRGNPTCYLTSTMCRSVLTGDVCTILKVHSFLEYWGLINYGLNTKKKNTKLRRTVFHHYSDDCDLFYDENGKLVNNMKTVGVKNESKDKWATDEVIRLMEGVEKFGDNWEKVSGNVKTKNPEKCKHYFLSLPIESQFIREVVDQPENQEVTPLLPMFDESNPIMSTVAFLSSTVDDDVVKAASNATLEEFKKKRMKLLEENEEGLESQDVKTVSTTALAVSSLRSSLISAKEENEIQKLLTGIVRKQCQKVEIQLEELKKIEYLTKKGKVE